MEIRKGELEGKRRGGGRRSLRGRGREGLEGEERKVEGRKMGIRGDAEVRRGERA